MKAKNMLDRCLPIEDNAISNLLEIDQRDTDVNIWEDAHISRQLPPKRRTFSFHKFHDTKNSNAAHNPPSVEQIHGTHRSSNPESDKKTVEPAFLQRKQIIYPFQDELEKERENYEAEFWTTRANWLDGKEDQGIHSKNTKKQSALGDSDRKGRSLHKLQKQEKYHGNDSEISHFSHLLNQKDCKSDRGTMRYSFNVEHKIYDINGRKIGRSVDHKDLKKTNKIDAILQLNMRETLRRLYNKHHREEHIELPFNYKPAEHERSTMVRQLLINLENMKDCQSFSQEIGKQERKEGKMKEAVGLESQDRADMKKIRKIVDLNAEAEKNHKNVGVARWSGKKPIPLARLS